MKRKRNVTIMDIARDLGISKSTVSRALTGNSNINPVTRDAVISAARRLEYEPNMLAQSLTNRETHTVGVVIPDIEKPFFASIVSGIQQVASETGYKVMITQSNESPETEIGNIQNLMASRVDGLLICYTKASQNFDYIRLLHKKGIPLVFFARVTEAVPAPKVVEEDYNGAYTMVSYLARKNRKRIGIIAGPRHLLASKLRLEGYLRALHDNNVAMDTELISHTNFLKDDVIESIDKWLNLQNPIDAIFSIYDAGAIDAIKYLKKMGVHVPAQVAVGGFGNDPVSSIIEPGLTTFKQSPIEIGRQAFRLFLNQQMDDGEQASNDTVIVKGELIIRESA